MFKELTNLETTNGMRYYRTNESRPNLTKIISDIGKAGNVEEAVSLARQLINADNTNRLIDNNEEQITRCMHYIKANTQKGMYITKEHMASYLHNECGIQGTRAHYGYTDPRGATEYALERLVAEGYLKKVKVRHQTDKSWWRCTILEAYEVV